MTQRFFALAQTQAKSWLGDSLAYNNSPFNRTANCYLIVLTEFWTENRSHFSWNRSRRPLSPPPSSAIRLVIPVDKDALGGSLEILVLTAPQGPQEAPKSKRSEEEGHGDEVGKGRHDVCANWPAPERLSGLAACAGGFAAKLCRRSAFPMTSSEEADMAIAAISGVTCPSMAIGTATAL